MADRQQMRDALDRYFRSSSPLGAFIAPTDVRALLDENDELREQVATLTRTLHDLTDGPYRARGGDDMVCAFCFSSINREHDDDCAYVAAAEVLASLPKPDEARATSVEAFDAAHEVTQNAIVVDPSQMSVEALQSGASEEQADGRS